MNSISVSELHQKLQNQPDLTVFDVRTPLEFHEMHVPNAVNLPLDQLNPMTMIHSGKYDVNEPLYLLCRSGQRASKAAEKLQAAGFQHAVVVTGGTQAWVEAGYETQNMPVKVMSLERQVRIAAGSLVVLGVILSLVLHPIFLALTAFVGCGLIFAGVTDWCGMGLLLAKAPWNQSRSNEL